jgi:membrane-associated protease RseP (regulator of RpoE activity)
MPILTDCPDSRAGQWSFRLFGVNVYVKFWFWVTILILGGNREPAAAVTWVVVCFVSILLHEFGHVWAYRFFNQDAEIVLYGWGGLAIPYRGMRTSLAEFGVSLAGPGAGFCLVGLTLAAARLSGAVIQVGWHLFLPVLAVSPALAAADLSDVAPSVWYVLLNDLLWVNFFWGLVNLLPVYPLDGGHAARAVLEQRDPSGGRRTSLILSTAVATLVALFGLLEGSLFMCVMFGILAVSSAQSLAAVRRRAARTPYR